MAALAQHLDTLEVEAVSASYTSNHGVALVVAQQLDTLEVEDALGRMVDVGSGADHIDVVPRMLLEVRLL